MSETQRFEAPVSTPSSHTAEMAMVFPSADMQTRVPNLSFGSEPPGSWIALKYPTASTSEPTTDTGSESVQPSLHARTM